MLKTLPGLIDPHVHLRDPGQTQKEDFFTGTSAALAGGYTTVIDMPNNPTPITTLEALNEKIKIAKDKIVCDIGFHFGSLGNNLDEFAKVKGKILGLKLYLNQTTGNFLLDKTHLGKIFQTWPKKLPILVHAEEKTFDDVLEVVRKHPRKLHLCHMSTKYELERVIDAKNAGLPVTCGVTPHHLFLSENDLNHLSSFGLMKPPLRKRSDVDFLWKHLDAIDLIESDHAPHTREEKQNPPAHSGLSSGLRLRGSDSRRSKTGGQAPFGVPGLETTLPLLLTAVSENRLTIDDVIRLCHTGPAKTFMSSSFDYSNNRTTYVEIDPRVSYEIKNDNLHTKCKWSPFDGWKVKGKVVRVTLRGKKVFDDGEILAKPGFGHILSPQSP